MEKRPLRSGTWLHLGRKGLLPCFEKHSALSVPQQMHQPAVQGPLGDACCPGTHSTGASVVGWAEMSFPCNLKGRKKVKEGDTVLRNSLSTLHWEIKF